IRVSSRCSKASSSSDWKTVACSSAPSASRVFDMFSRRRRKNPRRWGSWSSAAAGGGGASSPRKNSSCQVRVTRGSLGCHVARALEAAGDHAGDAVAAHAHPVEGVGGVHRPLLVRDDDELGPVRVAPDELEEAVDVDVVERGLDLVQDVEGARAGQEDGEHERQRDEGLLAARQQGQSLRSLARRRDLDLDARIVLLLLLVRVGLRRVRGVLAGDHGARPLLGVDEAEAAPAAREQVLDDVLEVPGRGLEGLLEALPDAAVGLLDEALELREGGLEVAPLPLQLLDVRHGLLVLLLRKRVHGAELLAAALEPLDAGGEGLALVGGERLGGGRRRPRKRRGRSRLRRRLARGLGVEAQPLRDGGDLALDLGRAVAHLLGGHLSGRHRFARLAQPGLDAGLLVGAGAQGGGGLLAAGGVLLEVFFEGVAAGAHGSGRAVERGGGALAVAGGGLIALDAGAEPRERAGPLGALALDPLGHAALGAERGVQLGAAHGAGALVGSLAAAGDDPLGAADRLGRLGDLAARAPERDLGLLAGGLRIRQRLAGAIGGGTRGVLVLDRLLGGGDELVAAAALLEDALGAAGGGLGELAGGRVEEAYRAGDGDAFEFGRQGIEGVDDPDVVQQTLRGGCGRGLGRDMGDEGFGPGRWGGLGAPLGRPFGLPL